MDSSGARRGRAAALALSLIAAACTQTNRQAAAPVFYPPAPALPRIQYLTSFTGLKDIEEQSAFNRFVVGEKENRQIDKPYGVAVYDGKIYVCDVNSTVTVLDLEAKSFAPLKGAVGAGLLRQPVNISVGSDGTKYVADPVRGQVVAFDRNDEYLKAYSVPEGWRPVDAVVFDNRLYVADIDHGLVVVLDKDSGAVLETIGNKEEPSQRLDRPTNLAFDSEGFLYVTDVGRFQVVKYDRNGAFQRTFGKLGDNLGHFARPKGIAVDRQGVLYAVDASFNNVQMFNKDGRLVLFFGDPGDKPGNLMLPAKISLDYDNLKYFQRYAQAGFTIEYLIFVTSQFGERRVNVFAFGHEEGKHYPTDEELLKEIEDRRAKARGALQAP